MLFEKFVDLVSARWKEYLSSVRGMSENGKLVFPDGHKAFYPNMIVFTKCSGYYLCELVGVTDGYRGLVIKRCAEKFIYRYLSQFYDDEPDPLFAIEKAATFRGLTLSTAADLDKVSQRFPCVELGRPAISRESGHGSVVGFGNEMEYCFFENCIFVNSREELYRCKSVLHLMVFKSELSRGEVDRLLSSYLGELEIHGVHCVPDEYVRRQKVAGQLQNLYLSRGLHETTLGEFFRLHPDVVNSAFKTQKFIYEPYLLWIQHDGTCTDSAINPDLMVRREDGLYDIYDLKTALLDRKNITKGQRKRRRFVDYVEEGVAQLANYAEYFSYPANAEFAKGKYGIEVSNPGLVLVVGSWENSDHSEIIQACRRYPGVRIIDYDTLCHVFLGNVGSNVGDVGGLTTRSI